MTENSVLSAVASMFIFSLLTFSPADGAQPEDYYQFVNPEIAPEKLAVEASATVIPKLLRITNIAFNNAILDPSLNDGNADIAYTIPEAGFVTIRVAREGTRELYLATVLNLEFRDAGNHTEIWDGRDYYGNSLYEMNTPISYRMQAESLAAGSAPPGYQGLDYVSGESQEAAIEKAKWQRHVHTWHKDKYEHIPLLTINSPESGDSLSGRVIVRSGVDRERRGFGDKYGYGVRYYVDNEIVHEEFYLPESGGNFSYELDTTPFDDGAHTLHVGLCDHNEHVTSHGIEVVFKNLGGKEAQNRGLHNRRHSVLSNTTEEEKS